MVGVQWSVTTGQSKVHSREEFMKFHAILKDESNFLSGHCHASDDNFLAWLLVLSYQRHLLVQRSHVNQLQIALCSTAVELVINTFQRKLFKRSSNSSLGEGERSRILTCLWRLVFKVYIERQQLIAVCLLHDLCHSKPKLMRLRCKSTPFVTENIHVHKGYFRPLNTASILWICFCFQLPKVHIYKVNKCVCVCIGGNI